jgi:hypothetical protein
MGTTTSTNCREITKPTVDETSVECTSLVSTDCVVTKSAYSFFGIAIGETITSVISKIMLKMQVINQQFTKTIDLTTLPVYADEAAATTAGLLTGKPYKDTNGFLRIKL